MLAVVAATALTHQPAPLSSSSFTSNALPKPKIIGSSLGFWTGLAGLVLGFFALYIGLLALPRIVNMFVAGKRAYEEGFLQIREVEGGTFELVETVVHASPITAASVGERSSMNEHDLLHKEGYPQQHHGSGVPNFNPAVRSQEHTGAAGQSGLDHHESASTAGKKAQEGRGE